MLSRATSSGSSILRALLTTTSVVVVAGTYELHREVASDEYLEKAFTTSLSLQSKAFFRAPRFSAVSAGAAAHVATAANKAMMLCKENFMIDWYYTKPDP